MQLFSFVCPARYRPKRLFPVHVHHPCVAGRDLPSGRAEHGTEEGTVQSVLPTEQASQVSLQGAQGFLRLGDGEVGGPSVQGIHRV